MTAVPAEDFRDYLDTLRRFTREMLVPAEAEVEEMDSVPEPIVERMRGLGLFGMSIPEAYGGLSLSIEQQVRATFEFTYASAVFRSRFSTTVGLASQAIVHSGTEEQKRACLPKLASGEWTASFALTEPGAGSDAAALTTRARMDGNEYVLDGEKCYITNAPEADLFVVMARSKTGEPGARGISAFLVERGTQGFTVGRPDRKLGQHGSHTASLYFADCRVPASALLGGEEGQGFRTAMAGINAGRMHIAAACVGQATRLLDEAAAYAAERKQFGQPIGAFQSVHNMLADSHAECLAARAMTLETARRLDRGEEALADISAAKYFASEMVGRVADRAVQILGGAGYMHGNPVERMYRDVRLFRIYEGTSQIHQMIMGREILRAGREGRLWSEAQGL